MALPCFSETHYGYSSNLSSGGSTWNPVDVGFPVPSVPGLDINGVIYSYTAEKQQVDPFTVTIQNENAITGGYIFSETDDWSGKPGNTINKAFVLPYTPISHFGEGSITTTGIGTVENPTVLYSYRFDPCFDPQNDPSCPGYQPPLPPPTPDIEIYDATTDEAVVNATAQTDPELYDSDEKSKIGDDEESTDNRLETALAATNEALNIADGMTQAQMLIGMNASQNLSAYYKAQIPGGEYREALVLKDKYLPDNPASVRMGMAADALHEKMVSQQWGR